MATPRLWTQTRRDFLAGSAALAGAATLPAVEAADRARDLGRARTISIFHTTDLHGHILPTSTYDGLDDVGGLARCATCIRQWRKESPLSLLVDVGDVVQGTAASLRRGGRIMFELFNRLGYDAWTLGNHDFDWGPEKLEQNLAASRADVLTANLTKGGAASGAFGGVWEKVKPWTIREVGGLRIALVGLITPGLPYWLPPEVLGGVEPLDPAATLRETLAAVEAEKPDAVVVLGHMGWKFKDDYANPVREVLKDLDGVDVYLAGHSHQNQSSWYQGDVLCSQASYYGIHCGRVDLTFDLDSHKLVEKRAFTLLMDDRYELDPLVMELAKADLDEAAADLGRTVATVQATISGKGRDSGLVRLLCECFSAALGRQGTRVDGVFHGSFGTGDLQPGPLTVAECWKIIPYENMLVTAKVPARDLVRIINEDGKVRDSDRSLWPLEVIRDCGNAVTIRRGEAPVGPDDRLTIAFNSYDAQSGGQRLMQTRAILAAADAERTTSPIDTRSALIEGLLERGTVG